MDSERLFQVLNHFKSRGIHRVPFSALERVMAKSGSIQFSKELFQQVFDYDDRIQHIVDDFNDNEISLGSEDPIETEPREPQSDKDDTSSNVSRMAKQANDLI